MSVRFSLDRCGGLRRRNALVRAGLETGCRYGELTRLEVCDFNPDVSTLAIRQSKTARANSPCSRFAAST
jgi:integrase